MRRCQVAERPTSGEDELGRKALNYCWARPLEQFRNWCRPKPDFLWRLVEPRNYMRLSVKKVAHNCSQPVLRRRKSGERQAFSWFSPKENHSTRSLSDHSNCETALI